MTCFLLAACASTPEELVAGSKYSATANIELNYQAVYAQLLKQGRQCYAGAVNMSVSNDVDGELFSDLKYGEMYFYQDNIQKIYYAVVRLDAVEDGDKDATKLTVSTGGQPEWASRKFGDAIVSWAQGNTECIIKR